MTHTTWLSAREVKKRILQRHDDAWTMQELRGTGPRLYHATTRGEVRGKLQDGAYVYADDDSLWAFVERECLPTSFFA